MAAARGPAALKLWHSALMASGMAGAAGAYQYNTDEGTRRSLYFWRRAFPIYLHYRWVQSRVKGLPEEEQDIAYQPLHEKYAPEALDIILHLKGFFTKIGQVASTRHDFLPREYLDRLTILQDDIPPEEFSYVKGVIEESLGQPIYEVFQEFDHRPIGAASIGQVHRAVLREGKKAGQEVAVKVMYPKVEHLFRTDIQTIKNFCRLAQPEHLTYIEEIEKQFLTEFDYQREGQNLEMIHHNMLKHYGHSVVVPRPVFAKKHVLAMEFLHGERLDKALRKNLEVIAERKGTSADALMREMERREAQGEAVQGASRSEMRYWRAYLRARDAVVNLGVVVHNFLLRPCSLFLLPKAQWAATPLPLNLAEMMDLLLTVHGHQILFDGCFNGDPHPGNILLLHPRQQLGLIDCGQVKHITLDERLALARLILAVASKDKTRIVKAYTDMGFRTRDMDDDVIYKHAMVIWDRDDKESLGGKNIQMFLEDLQKEDPVTYMPQQYVLAGRVAVLLRGLGYALKYRYSTADAWALLARKLLEDYGEYVSDSI